MSDTHHPLPARHAGIALVGACGCIAGAVAVLGLQGIRAANREQRVVTFKSNLARHRDLSAQQQWGRLEFRGRLRPQFGDGRVMVGKFTEGPTTWYELLDLAQAAAGKHLTDDELSNRETELWAAEERIVSASAALTRAEDVALSARGEDLPDACIVSMDAAGRIRYVRVGADSGLDRARTELADALAGRQALIQDAVAHASR